MGQMNRIMSTKTIRARKVLGRLLAILLAVFVGLLVYTIFTDGPDLIRGTKTISGITILSGKGK